MFVMITGNRCGRPFEDLDFCVDANNVLNLASTGSIIGNWEIDDKQQFGILRLFTRNSIKFN